MSDLVAQDGEPLTPSLSPLAPQLQPALADRMFDHAGQSKWDAEWALDVADRQGSEGAVRPSYSSALATLRPAPPRWFGWRLTRLWTMFTLGRQVDGQTQTVWMAEASRLLNDLPHDIVGHAIDEAIRSARHGFMPSIGEIRTIADPMAAARRQQVERLARMVDALDDPAATAARAERRDEARRRAAAH